ncbi:low temperature requirement protein A [Micromonospora sp. H33]|uniref:low temperature requirement protein A n=1 Tax=Micromonospora sp. H33 TaxID=3452215 RepID=UPI003F8AECCD
MTRISLSPSTPPLIEQADPPIAVDGGVGLAPCQSAAWYDFGCDRYKPGKTGESMTTGPAAGILREGGGRNQATFLELFFDLVFVFALTRVTQRLAEDFTTQRRIVLPEVGQTTLLFLALWLVWTLAAWVTSRYNPERPLIRLLIVAVMFGSMIMAVSVPEAFADDAPVFAGAYVTIQLGRPLALMLALRGDKQQQRIPARIACWSAVSAIGWIWGATLPEGKANGILWALALGVEYLGFLLGWPTPGLGRARIPGWRIAGEHLAERHQHFLIIALGESILLTGLTFSAGPFGVEQTAAFMVSFATTVLLWQIYFSRAGYALAEAVRAAEWTTRLSLSSTYTHMFMVAGILATAVGYELIIRHPTGHTDPAWLAVILGGPALFLAGRSRFGYEVFGRRSRTGIGGLLALAALAPGMVLVPPLAVASAALLVLAGVAVASAIRGRRRPSDGPTPPA